MVELNKIYCGDCLEVMKDIPDGSIDMILCDLPYGTTACKWDTIIPFEPLWEQYKRIIKDNGAIVLTSSQPFTSALVMSNIKMFKYEWIWVKNSGSGFLNASKMPMKKHENIVVFYKKLPTYNPQNLLVHNKIIKTRKTFSKETALGSIGVKNLGKEYLSKFTNFPISVQFCEEEKLLHPTQKPVALFEYLIKTYTNEGDLVLDNCAGSGTTGVACKNLNRNFILIEKEPEYIDIIKKRLL
jgi:site-specific DNA-methyltransferase (adenine-specific)